MSGRQMKRLRLYADTSVFGGCFDDEFATISRTLFDEVSDGRYTLVLSSVTLRELADAPKEVRELLDAMGDENFEVIPQSKEIEYLRDSYLRSGILGSSSAADAEHIAAASVASVDLIVSWNFKHIVHFDKIRQFHAVNLIEGYHPIPIHTPREVVNDAE